MKPFEYIIHDKRLDTSAIHNIIIIKTKRLSRDIIERHIIWQIKRGLYEEIQKSILMYLVITVIRKDIYGKFVIRTPESCYLLLVTSGC